MPQAGSQDVLVQFRSVVLLAAVGTCCATAPLVIQSQIGKEVLHRLESTIPCSEPSTSLQVSERKTLAPSSNDSVIEWASAGTDVFRSSVAMPTRMCVFLVFQEWLPMFARHPLQSEDTTQLVKNDQGYAFRHFAERHCMVLSNTFFWNTPTFYGVIGNTRVTQVHTAHRDTCGIKTFLPLQRKESIVTPSSVTWKMSCSDAFPTTHPL